MAVVIYRSGDGQYRLTETVNQMQAEQDSAFVSFLKNIFPTDLFKNLQNQKTLRQQNQIDGTVRGQELGNDLSGNLIKYVVAIVAIIMVSVVVIKLIKKRRA
jgi:Na+/H+-dicarboxylate symporter